MTSLRQPLADALAEALPTTWKVTGYPGKLERVSRRTVALWTTELAHLERAPNGHYVLTFTVALYSRHTDPDKADDELDDMLQTVIDALWTVDDIVLDRAERTSTNDQTLHAWVLTVRSGIKITSED